MILDMIRAELCHSRLYIGCVVCNGQCIGVKHLYGLMLVVYLNLVFTSDNHNEQYLCFGHACSREVRIQSDLFLFVFDEHLLLLSCWWCSRNCRFVFFLSLIDISPFCTYYSNTDGINWKYVIINSSFFHLRWRTKSNCKKYLNMI